MRDSLLILLGLAGCACAQGSLPTEGRLVTETATSGDEAVELDPRIWCIHQVRSGDIWFGSNGNGAYKFDGARVTHYTRADGLAGHQVRDIEEGRDGEILVSTTDGVSKFDGREWTELPVQAPTDGDGWRLEPEDVWIVVDPGIGGPCRYDGEKLYRLELTKSPAEAAHLAEFPDADFAPGGVYSIYEDRRGHLWFGTAAAGLCRYDGRSLSWMYEKRLTTTPDGGAFGIRSIHEDRAGDFWVCNTRQRFRISREVSRVDEFRLIDYEQRDGLPDAQSDTGENFTYYSSMAEDGTGMAEDDAGALWMACGSDGVWKYDGDAVTRHELHEGVYAHVIHRDREGRMWVGTLEHGVYTFNGESFVPFEPR
jgi:ligand-binding sensor domain-containing protein